MTYSVPRRCESKIQVALPTIQGGQGLKRILVSAQNQSQGRWRWTDIMAGTLLRIGCTPTLTLD